MTEPTQAERPKNKSRTPWIIAVIIAASVGGTAGALISNAAEPSDVEIQARIDGSVESTVAGRQAELDKREDLLDSRQKTIDSVKAAQERTEAAQTKTDGELRAREQALIPQEAEAALNVISGDGTYIPGVDINPGTYRATPSGQCYWERNSSTSGGDIIDNNFGAGPQVVTISEGDGSFQTRSCGKWTRAN